MSRAKPVLIAAGIVAALIWVRWAPFSVLGTVNLGLVYALVAVSLVLLTGWVGQISLAQASFVGIGAFVTGIVVRSWDVPFPLTLPIAAAVAAAMAALLGMVALRVRGLYLAVATLIFAWMTDTYLFNQAWFAGAGGSSSAKIKPLGEEGSIPYLDFADRKTFYYIALAVLAIAILAAANLRQSKTGRAWFALRGSEFAAASLGVDVTRYKLLAFATSGFFAGTAGSLVMNHQQVVTASAFGIPVSLFYLAIAVVGGLSSLGGAVAGALLFAGLEELFFRVDALAGLLDVVSAVLLGAVLLFFPAGLAGIPPRLRPVLERMAEDLRAARERTRERWATGVEEEGEEESPPWEVRVADWFGNGVRGVRAWVASRRAQAEAAAEASGGPPNGRLRRFARRRRKAPLAPDALAASLEKSAELELERAQTIELGMPPGLHYTPGTATKPELPPRPARRPVLHARAITVRFGGLVAVNDASLEVREGEIVGLIGPNGAGKTTLFNAISGLNQPTAGSVELFGQDITPFPVHERARMGMGRTFQVIQLFPQLSVFENLLVATHTRNPTGYLSHLAHTFEALRREKDARERCVQVVELLGLEDVAGRQVAGLPFGTLRQVELARALVTGAPFVMLDEPASGLDNAETDRLSDLLYWVRQTLGVTLLLIEHDVRMVTSVSDYMYVIDRGKIIADGVPDAVQRDPAVVAAYLGQPKGDVEPEPVEVG